MSLQYVKKNKKKKKKKEALMLPWNLILADSISYIDCTKLRGHIQLKLAPNDTPQLLLSNELGVGLGMTVAGIQDHLETLILEKSRFL